MKFSRSSPFVTKYLKNNIWKLSACRLHAHTTIPTNMIGSMCQLRKFCMIRLGASGLPFYRTPLVCVPAVIGGLSVRQHHNKTNPKNTRFVSLETKRNSFQSRVHASLTVEWALGVWIPHHGVLPIIASVSLTHIPSLFACFYESVSCVYTFFSTCMSICVARTACFVFCSIFVNTFLFSFFFFYRFNRHLCHVAYWCTHTLAHMPIFFSCLHFHLSNSCVYACQLVYALSSSFIFIYNYQHIHMYICDVLLCNDHL